jgi:decaprenylphospho-beta-D-erythro-pentofuranosid-2-ulose 2-reductase
VGDAGSGRGGRAADRGGPVVYAPWFWRWIMLAIRILPAAIFNRLDI